MESAGIYRARLNNLAEDLRRSRWEQMQQLMQPIGETVVAEVVAVPVPREEVAPVVA